MLCGKFALHAQWCSWPWMRVRLLTSTALSPLPLPLPLPQELANLAVFDDIPTPSSAPDGSRAVVSVQYVGNSDSIYIGLASGAVAALDLHECRRAPDPQAELLAVLEGGIAAMAWSPDEEIVAAVSMVGWQWSPRFAHLIINSHLSRRFREKDGMVSCLTPDLVEICAVPVDLDSLGDAAPVAVGWGQAETQFRGKVVFLFLSPLSSRSLPCHPPSHPPPSLPSPSNQAQKRVAAPVIPDPAGPPERQIDDGRPHICWRGDGEFFVTSTLHPAAAGGGDSSASAQRRLRVWTRDGQLTALSEPTVGLEAATAWRPAGNIIAAARRLANGLHIAFFERNGLRHGGFALPPCAPDTVVAHMEWNTDSSVLAILLHAPDGDALQLWTSSNYHWALKHEVRLPAPATIAAMRWDAEAPLALNILALVG